MSRCYYYYCNTLLIFGAVYFFEKLGRKSGEVYYRQSAHSSFQIGWNNRKRRGNEALNIKVNWTEKGRTVFFKRSSIFVELNRGKKKNGRLSSGMPIKSDQRERVFFWLNLYFTSELDHVIRVNQTKS